MKQAPGLKIAFYDPSGRGGICQYTFQLAQSLAESGCDVTVLTTDGYELQHLPRSFRLVVVFKKSVVKNWLAKIAGTQAKSSSRTEPAPENGGRVAIETTRWNLACWLKKLRLRLIFLKTFAYLLWHRPHVIHFQWLASRDEDLYFIGWLKRFGFPIVYTAHDLLPHDADTPAARSFFQKIYTVADRLVVHAESIRHEMVELFHINPDKIWVVSHGSNILFSASSKEAARARLEIASDKKVILFFGLIKRYKGLEYLLEAFEQIRAQVEGAVLLIAGSIADEDKVTYAYYRNLLLRFAGDQSVKCRTEYIPLEQAGDFFSAADVVALPHVKPSQSGVLLSAIAAGKPVVVTDAGGFTEVIENGRSGFVVPPGHPKALAEALVRIFQTNGLLQSMGKEAKALADTNYSWRTIAARTVHLYHSLLMPLSPHDGKTALGRSEVRIHE